MKTPVGSIKARMVFSDHDGVLTGTADGAGESVPLRDLRLEQQEGGLHALWAQKITKPMRLTLQFDVLVDGDRMHGFSRAGKLPKSSVIGERSGNLPQH